MHRFFHAMALALLLSAGSAAVALAGGTFSVGAIAPLSATVNVAQTYTASFSSANPLTSCMLYADGALQGSMSLSGSLTGTASRSLSFATAGSHTAYATCTDSMGNVETGATSTISVAASTMPSIGSVSPTSVAVSVGTTLSASYSSTTAVTNCDLHVDGVNQGSMSLSGSLSGTASKSFAFSTSGTHTAFVRCTNSAGEISSGATTTISVSASADTTVPSRPLNLVLTSVSGDSTPSFSWSASSDNMAVTGYEVQIDGGAFAPIGNALTYTASAQAGGSHTFGVRARDAAGNVSSVSTVAFTVTGTITPPPLPPSLQPPFEISQMSVDAALVASAASRATLETQTGRTCEFSSAAASARVSDVFGSIADATMRTAIENFVGCGTISTRWLGAGERIGIVNSYRAAFGRLPSTTAHWSDVVKIGNGRFTAETSASAEAAAKVTFKKIYLRDANMSVESDRNAVTVMAYGLRPLPRNLSAETSAIVTFRAVYGRTPTSAQDWDAVRAVAYSGATR